MTLWGRWFARKAFTRQEKIQLLTLRKVIELMATWNDIKNDITALKEETVKLLAVLQDVRDRLAKALAAETIDPAELQAAHDAVGGVIGDMEAKVHADGM